MDTGQNDNLTLDNMPSTDTNSETARLMNNSAPKPSYINVFNNLCALIFVSIICYACFVDPISFFTFHPIFMSVGWLLIMVTAINAVTPGDLATEWMPIRLRSARHWVLQLFGGILVILGFLAILINKIIYDKSHFVTLHSKFGLSSLIFMFVTMLGGLCALYSLKVKHYLAPIYTKLLHATFGLLTFSFGVVTIILGLFSNWWKFGEILQYTNVILVSTITLCTILRPTLKIYFRFRERMENMN